MGWRECVCKRTGGITSTNAAQMPTDNKWPKKQTIIPYIFLSVLLLRIILTRRGTRVVLRIVLVQYQRICYNERMNMNFHHINLMAMHTRYTRIYSFSPIFILSLNHFYFPSHFTLTLTNRRPSIRFTICAWVHYTHNFTTTSNMRMVLYDT